MLSFCKVESPMGLLPILKSRHPQSCFMQNQVKKHKGFESCLSFYTVGNEINENTWIVSELLRKDYGSHISISAPSAIIKGEETVGDEIKDVFSSGGNVINWDERIVFVALEKPVSKLILDVSVNVKGNVTEVHPCNLYYMEIDDALKLEVTNPPFVEVRKLDPSKNEENFILSTWKYALPGSEFDIRQSIEVNASGGVFLEGKCVSGVNIPGYGLLSALYTDKEHRNKGYGKATMKFAFREFARDGCIPCLTVERRNPRSIQFHEALGAKLVSVVDWMDIIKLDVD